MKSSGMKWIIPAVIVAITALIVFQVNWLMREAEMKKEDEQRRAGEAVRATCMAMEDQLARGLIGTSFDSVINNRPLLINDSVRIEMRGDSMRQVLIINNIESEGAHTELRLPHPPPPPPMPDMPPGADSLPVPPPPVWIGSDSADIVVMRRAEHAKNAFQDVMMEYVFSSGLPAKVDSAKLDSTLHSQLQLNGISYPYTYTLVDGPGNHLRSNGTDVQPAEWEFCAKVYSNDPAPFAPELRVEIQPGDSSVFMRILPQITFSFLITGGMLLLFLLIYREAVKQKKISDIRRDFINNMTHEFKTPLATMSLAADTIMNEKIIGDKDKVKYYAEQIKAENRKLNQQVEKVLELALTEKTGVVMHKEPVNVTELLLRAMKAMELQAEAKGGTIVMENNPQELQLNADAFHLERVFVNLFDNALKYGGKPPRIAVRMEQFRSGTQIKISDNGSGIPPSEWGLIFDPFYRVSTGDVHNVKGFGLGLSYAQSVIKEHGGSISVEKSNGSGTTFTVLLMHQ